MARFQIRIDPVWQPVLLLGGATKTNSYVEVSDGDVSINFGYLFTHIIPRSNIESVAAIEWPFWKGIGWRSNLQDQAGLTGSYNGVVEVKLSEPIRVWLLLNCTRIAISMEEPETFVAALS